MDRPTTPLVRLRVGEEIEIDHENYIVEAIRDIHREPLSSETYRRHPYRQRATLCIRLRNIKTGRKLSAWGYKNNKVTPVCLYGLTTHAVERMNERGITAQDINMVVALGERHEETIQGYKYYIYRLSGRHLEGYNRESRKYLESLYKTRVVMDPQKIVITVYRDKKKKKKRIKI